MSAYLWAELVCEGDNCGENLRAACEPGTVTELRKEAKEKGWRRQWFSDHYEDRCPDCVTCVVVDA